MRIVSFPGLQQWNSTREGKKQRWREGGGGRMARHRSPWLLATHALGNLRLRGKNSIFCRILLETDAAQFSVEILRPRPRPSHMILTSPPVSFAIFKSGVRYNDQDLTCQYTFSCGWCCCREGAGGGLRGHSVVGDIREELFNMTISYSYSLRFWIE